MAHKNQPKIIAGIIDQTIAVSLIKGTWWLSQSFRSGDLINGLLSINKSMSSVNFKNAVARG